MCRLYSELFSPPLLCPLSDSTVRTKQSVLKCTVTSAHFGWRFGLAAGIRTKEGGGGGGGGDYRRWWELEGDGASPYVQSSMGPLSPHV